jgi:hypothetical protein
VASSAHSTASFFTNRTGDPLLPYGTSFIQKLAIIVDVEPTPARTFDEVRATATMLDRTKARFGIKPKRLAADTAYSRLKIGGAVSMMTWPWAVLAVSAESDNSRLWKIARPWHGWHRVGHLFRRSLEQIVLVPAFICVT